MRHVRETMPGSGDSGTGRNQRPATSAPTPRPTTPFIPNRHPGLVPPQRPICPHSPKPTEAHTSQTNPTSPATSTPRPTTPFIPNRHPGLVPHPIYPHSPKPTEAHTSQTNPTGPATSTPRPTTPFIPNRHPGLVPHPICPHSPICTQPTGTPRCPAPTRHPGLASAPLMRSKRRPPRPNTPHSPNFTEVVCTLGASIPNTVRSAHIHQSARNPRIRHAARPPTDTPASHPPHSCAQNADHLAQTPHIHPISPKWSALWAHTVQLEARRRRHNGCAYDLHHCGARTLHHRCKQR